MTIVEAIQRVLGQALEPLSVDQIHSLILDRTLYSFKAVDPKSVVRSQVRRHCLGLDFPSASPVKYFKLAGDDRYSLESTQGVRTEASPAKPVKNGRLPEEVIDDSYKEHLHILRQQLKEKILQNHPAFFERLVIELLLRMGYGGNDPTLGIHTGGPGDGGIDGIIKEDKLGLEQIYIQAKRYSLDREVKRTDVQRFAGAMNKVKKGVFITTASFAANALEFARSHEKTISLIDGDLLFDLMIANGVGVSEVKQYKVLRIDSDYFAANE
jgi:restriction system protein